MTNTRPLIPVPFALAILFFFFTFCEFNCSGQRLGSVTGINLVTGSQMQGQQDMFGNQTQGEKVPSNMWAVIAFACAIAGVAVFVIKGRTGSVVGTAAGLIGVIALIILQFNIKDSISDRSQGQVQAEFKMAYWLSLLLLLAGALLSYLGLAKAKSGSLAQSPLNAPAGAGVKYCSNCGTQVQGDAQFCNECGQSIK